MLRGKSHTGRGGSHFPPAQQYNTHTPHCYLLPRGIDPHTPHTPAHHLPTLPHYTHLLPHTLHTHYTHRTTHAFTLPHHFGHGFYLHTALHSSRILGHDPRTPPLPTHTLHLRQAPPPLPHTHPPPAVTCATRTHTTALKKSDGRGVGRLRFPHACQRPSPSLWDAHSYLPATWAKRHSQPPTPTTTSHCS